MLMMSETCLICSRKPEEGFFCLLKFTLFFYWCVVVSVVNTHPLTALKVAVREYLPTKYHLVIVTFHTCRRWAHFEVTLWIHVLFLSSVTDNQWWSCLCPKWHFRWFQLQFCLHVSVQHPKTAPQIWMIWCLSELKLFSGSSLLTKILLLFCLRRLHHTTTDCNCG